MSCSEKPLPYLYPISWLRLCSMLIIHIKYDMNHNQLIKWSFVDTDALGSYYHIYSEPKLCESTVVS